MNLLFPESISDCVSAVILSIVRSHSTPSTLLRRLKAILLCNSMFNGSKVANEVGATPGFVKKWRDKASHVFNDWPNTLTCKKEVRSYLMKAFSDTPRLGAPATYCAEQFVEIMAVVLKPPTEFGREITHWTIAELTDEVQRIAPGISTSTIGRFLRNADIRPHHIAYWLEPKIEDDESFRREVKEVCDTYHQAPELARANTYTVSVDKKTGTQALERIVPNKPVKRGFVEKMEFEYKRHGTLCLTPSFNVVTGKIMEYRICETRNEQDFCAHIKNTVALSPDSEWIFVADQLNVHKSESLVKFIAEACSIDEALGVKGKEGILKDQISRQAFLTDKSHRIRFVFTPKHCSWLNQVEIWFGILSRKVLNRGSFKDKEDLRSKMEKFIRYFNETMAKPYKWTYKGKALAV